MRPAPPLLLLDCGDCGAAYPGLDADVAFVCAACRTARELDDGRLVPRDFVQVAVPAAPPAVRVNLPVWCFPARVEATPSSPAASVLDRERLAQRSATIRRAYVLACSIPRVSVFGDWGHRWTGLQPEWSAAESARPVVGAATSSADARLVAQHMILDLLDRQLDLGHVDAAITLDEPTLLAVPVHHHAGRLRSSWGDLTLPGRALDSYLEIVDAAADRP